MKFENTMVYNIDRAMVGMRNPKNSWDKNDTILYVDDTWTGKEVGQHLGNGLCVYIGPNDMKLAQNLIKSGPEHRKFLRQIFVCVDITAPLYYLKEFDTYKVGTVANSTSTMHKLTSKPITIDCFELDDWEIKYSQNFITDYLIPYLEKLRQKFIETKDIHYWKELVRWLPEGWLQTRTVTLNYENILTMYFQRRNHKLTEWHSFCKWCESLPYFKEFILILDKNS